MNRAVAAKRAYLREENRKYGRTFVEIPREEWPLQLPIDDAVVRLRVWRSRDFLVQAFSSPDGSVRLSVNTTEMLANGSWREGLTWDDLQAIKQGVGYGDRWAVEVYPPSDSVVNIANMRHLWILASAPTYAWQRGAAAKGEL